MSLMPGTTLGPYSIVSQLGSGGMGVVYQATDPRLKRTVAIKLLPPDLTRDETAKQRFLQEAQAASALDHPNICTIFEINETDDGQLYLVMAHYEGETLKERIANGPLSLESAIDIATQIGEGLAKAHTVGIVHRDIKPANLMVTADGSVKILDFGLAKLAGTEGMTQTGTTLGTVAYMSPEQARGQEVDHRTDIWSLGVVLYEILAGEPPFRGGNLLSISNAILEQAPPSLRGQSSAAQAVIAQALNKDRERRHPAVTDLLGDLRKLKTASDVLTVVTSAQQNVPSIAVLPFRNMSADPEQEYFCEGLAEELIDALARLDGLRVAARTSAFQFSGKGHDLAEVGEKLKVKTILEGSVRRAGNRLRVNAQLIDAADGYHLWSERYDRTMDDVFDLQDEIAKAVVEKLRVKLLGVVDNRLVKRTTDNLQAYNLVLEGRHHRDLMTAPSFNKSLDCFERAIALEPAYAQAHAGIATCRIFQAIFSLERPQSVAPLAKEAALRALEIDDTVADAHAALARVMHWYEWDWAAAEREYRRALDLNPLDDARGEFAQLMGMLGRTEEGIREGHDLVERDPLSPSGRIALSLVMMLARRFDDMVAVAKVGIELSPSVHMLHMGVGWGSTALGRYEEADEEFLQAAQVAPGDPVPQAYRAWALGLAGETEEVEAILEDLKRRRSEDYVGGWLMAHASLGLGLYDQAMGWLEKGFEEHDPLMTFAAGWAGLDPLRSDPRFQALLQRMNFPQQQ